MCFNEAVKIVPGTLNFAYVETNTISHQCSSVRRQRTNDANFELRHTSFDRNVYERHICEGLWKASAEPDHNKEAYRSSIFHKTFRKLCNCWTSCPLKKNAQQNK